MIYILLIVGLIGAGIYTGDIGFYWAAGGLTAFAALMQLLAVIAVVKISSKVKKDFDAFDHKWFGDK